MLTMREASVLRGRGICVLVVVFLVAGVLEVDFLREKSLFIMANEKGKKTQQPEGFSGCLKK